MDNFKIGDVVKSIYPKAYSGKWVILRFEWVNDKDKIRAIAIIKSLLTNEETPVYIDTILLATPLFEIFYDDETIC